jgi:hypothetical protein
MDLNAARLERLRIAALSVQTAGRPIGVARDEGGWMTIEVINPWNPIVEDWRFHKSDDGALDWTPRVVEEENGQIIVVVCTIEA